MIAFCRLWPKALSPEMNGPCQAEAHIFTEALGVRVEKRGRLFLEGGLWRRRLAAPKVESLASHPTTEMGDFLQNLRDEAASQARNAALADEKPLDRIGRYKLLETDR